MHEFLNITTNFDVTFEELFFGNEDEIQEKQKESLIDKLGLTPEQIAKLKKELQ